MLKIDNLAVSKELNRAEMGAIVGGNSAYGGINTNYNGGFSFARVPRRRSPFRRRRRPTLPFF